MTQSEIKRFEFLNEKHKLTDLESVELDRLAEQFNREVLGGDDNLDEKSVRVIALETASKLTNSTFDVITLIENAKAIESYINNGKK